MHTTSPEPITSAPPTTICNDAFALGFFSLTALPRKAQVSHVCLSRLLALHVRPSRPHERGLAACVGCRRFGVSFAFESGFRYRVGSFAFDWRVGTVAFCGFYSRRGMMGSVPSTSWCKLHVDFADCMRIGISMADVYVGTVAFEYVY
jgi:hypothetical protein